eukprot:TRINITY_DN2019_c0_g1_i10.p1 TRINITY_DN2019_c0_g1~~TRINITY_DN2019_c0_g1_i10.p1  ORF type:complete len:370 (-),score=52.67 TRINITY_DN2019_c0_g1_i10:1180-2289(-)
MKRTGFYPRKIKAPFFGKGSKFLWFILLVSLVFLVFSILSLQSPIFQPHVSIPNFDNTSFFFAVNFYKNEKILPNWMKEWGKIAKIIGPQRVFLSVYENDSKDKTKTLLREFQSFANSMGVENFFLLEEGVREKFIKGKVDRITYLSGVRNKALQPLFEINGDAQGNWYQTARQEGQKVWVVFVNDIYFKAEDIFRLMTTRNMDYDMACGMDFYGTFYDRWVTRDLNGDTWVAEYPYVRHPESQKLLKAGKPLDVISCWNGAVVMNSDPFLKYGLQFHGNQDGSCYHSECYMICRDFEMLNYTRIVLNPQVRVAYDAKHYYYQNLFYPVVSPLIALFNHPQPSWSKTVDQSTLKYNPVTGRPLTVACGS